ASLHCPSGSIMAPLSASRTVSIRSSVSIILLRQGSRSPRTNASYPQIDRAVTSTIGWNAMVKPMGNGSPLRQLAQVSVVVIGAASEGEVIGQVCHLGR